MNICNIMLSSAQRRKQASELHMPALRRQIAGELEQPYDLTSVENRDLKLYCEMYNHYHKTDPPYSHINILGLFKAEDNLLCLAKL
jgi:hypothetical protein